MHVRNASRHLVHLDARNGELEIGGGRVPSFDFSHDGDGAQRLFDSLQQPALASGCHGHAGVYRSGAAHVEPTTRT